jgi:SAM-dependent methyltransferase
VECIGHFAQPARFLADLRTVLRPGGVFVCCMNVATAPLPLSLRTVLSATYGFVPRPLPAWRALAQDAGFEAVGEGDLTQAVLVEGIAHVRVRLQRQEVQRSVPFAARALVRAQLEVAAAAVHRGALGYAWLVVRRAP